MGFADRDYVRQRSAPPVGVMAMWSVTTWLIVINVAVYLLNSVVGLVVTDDYGRQLVVRPIAEFGHFSVYTAIKHYQVWRFITFQFLHANLTHLLFNMFALYMFGGLIEGYLGRRRFLGFYLLSGIGGPIAYLLLWGLGVWGPTVPSTTPLVGASAGIFGVLVAAAVIAPDATVLIYGSIPAKLKTVAWVLLALAVFTAFTGGHNAGGEAAHLGGAVVGWLLIQRPQLLNFLETGYRSGRPRMTYR